MTALLIVEILTTVVLALALVGVVRRTFNPKVAGSIPARPIDIHCSEPFLCSLLAKRPLLARS
jgi:hypothetical protein